MRDNLYKAKILANKQLTDNIYQLVCEVIDYDGFKFEPGQYIIVEKNIAGDVVKRAYSFSSIPDNLPNFELTIRKYPEGKLSPYLTGLKAGDIFDFIGPMGVFNWEKRQKNKVVLVAIGCGIAPLKSMIGAWLAKKNTDLNLSLFFGNRYFDQVSYQKYFSDLASKYPDFHYYSCVSRLDQKRDGFFMGRVNQVMTQELKSFLDTDFFLCGSREMLADVMEELFKQGVKSENIFFENILI